MKKVKIAFWIILIGFFALIFFQNQEFFMKNQSLQIDLAFTGYQTPELPSALFFLAFFMIGLLISYFSSLSYKFRSGKEIKKLNAVIISKADELSAMRNEIDAIKKSSPAPEGVDEVEVPLVNSETTPPQE
jgi:uncharacterized integral membrane protein